MTTTAIISAQSFGTGSNVGNFLGASKTTLQAATTACIVAAAVTLGDNASSPTNRLRVWFAVSPTNHASAAVGCRALQTTAKYIDVNCFTTNNGLVVERVSLPIAAAAGYMFCWLEAPKLPTAATVTVNLMESP